jgi:type II secretory pathway pseudopilin PulG
MPRKGGLGAYGKAKVERAFREVAEEAAEAQRSQIRDVPQTDVSAGNPSVTSTIGDEVQTMPPPEDWWIPTQGSNPSAAKASFGGKSTRIATAAYDPESQRLYVLFHKPSPVGTPWTYEGVSESEWRSFTRSPSPGRYVNQVLNAKNKHRGSWL